MKSILYTKKFNPIHVYIYKASKGTQQNFLLTLQHFVLVGKVRALRMFHLTTFLGGKLGSNHVIDAFK